MNYSVASRALSLLLLAALARGDDTCAPEALEFHTSIGMQVEKVGSVPTDATNPWSYNMMPADNLDRLYFMDQQFGKIYCYDEADKSVKKVFDMSTPEQQLPEGIDLSWTYGTAAQTQKVHAMSQGRSIHEVYVVLMSKTLPAGWTQADATLPAEGAFPGYACKDGVGFNETHFFPDMYRMGLQPDCFSSGSGLESFTGYEVFTSFFVHPTQGFVNPNVFFVSEIQVTHGHMGGGIVTVEDGKILWGVGDCLLFGTDGRHAPQLDDEICGKILLIDPNNRSYDVVAKGVRNSQQFRIVNSGDKERGWDNKWAKDYLVFADIGGVTAEEVNARSLKKILKTNVVDNFGWGRSIVDGKSREGTFYLEPGVMGILGTEPPCKSNAPVPEPRFVQPWVQFGRTATDFYYAISSFAVAYESFDKLELIWSEFNTGYILGTTGRGLNKKEKPVTGHKIKLYDADMNELVNGCNDLVKKEQGEVGYYRGDPRLFHFPDGTAGVFIERTGVFYTLTETSLVPSKLPSGSPTVASNEPTTYAPTTEHHHLAPPVPF